MAIVWGKKDPGNDVGRSWTPSQGISEIMGMGGWPRGFFWSWNKFSILIEATLLGGHTAIGPWSERGWESDSTNTGRIIEGSCSPQPFHYVWFTPPTTKPHILWHLREPDIGDCAEFKGPSSHGDIARIPSAPHHPTLPFLGHGDNLELSLPQGPTQLIYPILWSTLSALPCPWNLQAFPSFTSIFPEPQVLWLPDEDRANVQQRAPRMRQIYGQLGVNNTERPLFLNLPYQYLPQLDMK